MQLCLLMAATAAITTACSSEDVPAPGEYDIASNYMPAPDDNSETAQMRRDFTEKYGSYLLFNDTLQHVFLGKDINGDDRYFTEHIDIEYRIGQTSTSTDKNYSYTLITDVSTQRMAVEFLEEYILPHLGTRLKPFSWLLAATITHQTNMNTTVRPYAVTGQRCYALKMGDLKPSSPVRVKQQLANRQLTVVVGGLVNDNSDEFSDFLAVSGAKYGQDTGFTTNEEVLQVLRANGFISVGSYSRFSFPRTNEDINAFVSTVINYNDEAIERMYGSYPLIMQKVRLMKETLTRLGYNF